VDNLKTKYIEKVNKYETHKRDEMMSSKQKMYVFQDKERIREDKI
jgi:hypothetical protein